MVYRLVVKNNAGKYQSISGIDIKTCKPIFVNNIMHGICFWNQNEDSIRDIADNITCKYPELDFKLIGV